MTKYTTILGDTWDIISYKVYGDSNIHSLIKAANPDYTSVFIFQDGISLTIPPLERSTQNNNIAPWRK